MRGREPSRKTIPPAARIGTAASMESAMSMPTGVNARAASGRSCLLAQKGDPHHTQCRRKSPHDYGSPVHDAASESRGRSRRVFLHGSAAHARPVILNAGLTYLTYGRSGERSVRRSCILHAYGCAPRKSHRNLRRAIFYFRVARELQRLWNLDMCRSTNGCRMIHDHEFKCPKCQAQYKVVRMDSGSQAVHQSLHCKICRQPLAPTHEGHILKYFLVRRPSAARGA